jgi:hypothetical protein
MSVTILSQPNVSLSADNALYVVSGSNFASGNYRFVADVSGTALLSRLKCDKLPNNQGFFNVARVVETLVPITKPAVTFFQDPLIASTYTVGFREEYGTPPVVATGQTIGSGIVFQGYKRQWESFVASGYYSLDSSVKILSKQPTKRKIRLAENDFASVLFHVVTGSCNYRVFIENRIRSFNVSGVIQNNELNGMFNTGLAGIYALTSGQTSDGRPGSFRNPFWTNTDEFASYDARATADGAVSDSNACAFNIFDGLVDFNGYDSYTVWVQYEGDVPDAYYYSEDRTSEDYTIEYEVETCERFVPQRLFFKNSLGGFDGYTFTMKNRKAGTMAKQTFGKNQNVYGTKVAETIYSANFEEVLTLNSDWLTDANWMSELIYSPQVYLQIGTELVEAIVNTTSFVFHTRPQDKLQQLQVEVKIAYKNNVI